MQDLTFEIGTKAPELLFVELTSTHDDQQLSTILDNLLTQLEMYHEYDEIDDDFIETAELTLMLIYHGVHSASTELDIFKKLSTDTIRLRYLKWKHLSLIHHRDMIQQMIAVMIMDRNFSDAFDPIMIANELISIFGSAIILRQIIIQAFPIDLLYQHGETYQLHKRVISIVRAIENA